MAQFQRYLDADTGVLIYTISGELVDGELLAFVTDEAKRSEKESSKFTLFDFRQTFWNTASLEAFKRNVMVSSQIDSPIRFVAMVFSRPEDFGLGKIIESFGNLLEFSASSRAFMDYDQAMAWLQRDRTEDSPDPA